jgi:Glyoxalase/Bleomycin resistance protein/Dioxygenase superfamily
VGSGGQPAGAAAAAAAAAGPAGITASFWHAGIVVTDLEQAMSEIGRATGARWLPPQERPDGGRVIRVTFSQSPPYLELIEGNPGGLWETAAGPRVDHLAYWTGAFDAECAHLSGMGLRREAGGRSAWGGNWAYFALPAAGIRVELCDTAGRDAFFQRWNLAGGHSRHDHSPHLTTARTPQHSSQ